MIEFKINEFILTIFGEIFEQKIFSFKVKICKTVALKIT